MRVRHRSWSAAVVLSVGLWPVAASAQAAAPPGKEQGGASRYDAGGRRDPFEALVRDGRLVGARPEGSFDAAEPVLYGILWDAGGQSIALINNEEFKVGDQVGRYRVAEIRRDGVVLASEGGEPLVLQIAFEVPPTESAPDTTKGGGGP